MNLSISVPGLFGFYLSYDAPLTEQEIKKVCLVIRLEMYEDVHSYRFKSRKMITITYIV